MLLIVFKPLLLHKIELSLNQTLSCWPFLCRHITMRLVMLLYTELCKRRSVMENENRREQNK